MYWPAWSVEKATDIQAFAALLQFGSTLIALVVAIAVPMMQQWAAQADSRARREAEIAGLRLALRTEIGMIGRQCLLELASWDALSDTTPKNVRTAQLPALTVYVANANKIGRLTRREIVILIKFSGTLFDLAAVVNDLARKGAPNPVAPDVQSGSDRRVLKLLLSNACGAAAELLTVIQEPGADDAPFISELETAYKRMQFARLPGTT